MTKTTAPEIRLWRQVEKTDGCWNWTGGTDGKGYGLLNTRAGTKRVHRFAYTLLVGPIPAGMLLDHTCHNKACVNPDHLRLATNKQNLENLSGAYVSNQTGLRGVGYDKRSGTYRARVRHNGILHSAGSYPTPAEAAEAAAKLRLSLFTHNDLDRASA